MPRPVWNPYREAGPFAQPDGGPVRAFHRSLPGYAPTPLVRRPALARELGLRDLLIKYEEPRFGLGAFKALGASWALHRLRARLGAGPVTVSTASEGNHGRGVAWSARRLGIPCVIFLPAHAACERVDAIRGEGAAVVRVEGSYEDAVRRCDAESRRRGWQVVSDVGYPGYLDIPRLVVEGYSTLYAEVEEQLAGEPGATPDLVLIPGGVGGLLHAGVDHYRQRGQPPRLVAVEPVAGDCLTESISSPTGQPAVSRGDGRTSMACLACAEVSLPSWPAIRRGVDLFLAIEDGFAEEAVRRLARAPEGETPLAAGSSGAASTGGLIALMRDPACREARARLALGPTSVALAICTEGAIDRADFARILGEA